MPFVTFERRQVNSPFPLHNESNHMLALALFWNTEMPPFPKRSTNSGATWRLPQTMSEYCSLNPNWHPVPLTVYQVWAKTVGTGENIQNTGTFKKSLSRKHYSIPQGYCFTVPGSYWSFIWPVMMEHLKCVPSGMTGSNGPSSHYCLPSWTVDGPPMCHYTN